MGSWHKKWLRNPHKEYILPMTSRATWKNITNKLGNFQRSKS